MPMTNSIKARLREVATKKDALTFSTMVIKQCVLLTDEIGTVDLLERIWPLTETSNEDVPARLALYRVLNIAVAEGLLDGYYSLRKGKLWRTQKEVNKKFWHAFKSSALEDANKRRLASAPAVAQDYVRELIAEVARLQVLVTKLGGDPSPPK